MRPILALGAAALLSACASDFVPIRYGKDTCAHCRMAIADQRFGAEAVNPRGKAYTFDAVECLAAWLDEHPGRGAWLLWVTDYEHAPRFLRAQEAVYVRSPRLRSPMGADLAAFAPRANAAVLARRYGGEALTWMQMRALVRTSGAHHGARTRGMPMSGHDTAGAMPPGMPMRDSAVRGAGGMPPGMPMPGHGGGDGGATRPGMPVGPGTGDSARAPAHGQPPES